MLLTASFVVNILSGLTFVAAGALLLTLRPARAGAVGFAAYALLSGTQQILANLGSALTFGSPAASMLLALRHPFLAAAPVALVWGAARYANRREWWAAPSALVSAVALGLMAVAPDTIVAPLGLSTDLARFLTSMPDFLALGLAALLLERKHDSERSAPLRQEALLLLFALLPFLAYNAGVSLVLFWANRAFFGVPVTAGYILTFCASLIAVALTSARLWRSGDPWARRLALGSVSVALVGIAQGFVDTAGVYLGGTIRIAAALLLGYGLLKYRLFDIDIKVKKGLARGIVAALGIGGFFLASEIAESFVADRTGSTLMGLAVAGALVVLETRVTHAGRRLAQRALPRVEDSVPYLDARKVTVYRSAIESAGRDGTVTPRERTVLSILARELGLTPDDATRIEREALGDAIPG